MAVESTSLTFLAATRSAPSIVRTIELESYPNLTPYSKGLYFHAFSRKCWVEVHIEELAKEFKLQNIAYLSNAPYQKMSAVSLCDGCLNDAIADIRTLVQSLRNSPEITERILYPGDIDLFTKQLDSPPITVADAIARHGESCWCSNDNDNDNDNAFVLLAFLHVHRLMLEAGKSTGFSVIHAVGCY